MFLSKCSGGYYYLFFLDELGRRRKVSTRARLKADALKFLREFQREEPERKKNLARVSLSVFASEYLEYSKGVHTTKTRESNQTALKELHKIVGDIPLHKVGVKEIERFLALKTKEASAWSARKYYLALAAAFETARRWGHIASNPFRLAAPGKAVRSVKTTPLMTPEEGFDAMLLAQGAWYRPPGA